MNKTVLITGTSSGFGASAANYFAAKGWNVIATMRDTGKTTSLSSSGNIFIAKLDVEDQTSIRNAVQAGIDRFGKIDVLVNNAGYGLFGVFESVSVEAIKNQFAVNVFGAMDVTRAILPHFREKNSGVVINVSSGAGAIGSAADDDECKGHSVFVHPDFFAEHPLAKSIAKYGFSGYHISEALHLSEKERDKVLSVLNDIREELETAIDDTSQQLITSYIEVLPNYSNRYYKRQFITRKAANKPIVERFEQALSQYYDDGLSLEKGIPSVRYFSEQLHVSSGYLSDLLRNLTGLNTQQPIHAKLIEVAKQRLSQAELTAAQTAYELGFEHPQSFNKLFKNKTGMTPMEFRERLN